MSSYHNYLHLRQAIDPSVKLVVVSKNRTWEEMEGAYEAGARDFGESKIQEFLQKKSTCPPDICWHFIGTLQLNKVAKAIDQFTLIHSIDNLEVAEKLARGSVLLQVNTSQEASKHGFTEEELVHQFETLSKLPLSIQGLMTMAPYTQDQIRIRECFKKLRGLRDQLGLKELSMGMSNDWEIALQEGATIVRIGTAIFNKKECYDNKSYDG